MTALADLTDRAAGDKAILAVAAELVRRGITPEDVGKVRRISMWQSITKDKEGDAHLHDLFGFQINPAFEDGPAWPVVQPGPQVKVSAPKLASRGGDASSVAVVLPDMQCGYYRNADGTLEAIHDERAIDAALMVIAAAKPRLVVLLGDNLDGAELGKYRLTPAFATTTQATLDYLTILMGRLRAAAPGAEIVWLAGNHEERLSNYVLDNARAAFGLRQGNTPSGWPVLSIPHLCRLDDNDVQYRPGYPASEVWITPQLRCIHGHKVRSSGSTAHAYLPELRTSVIYGHVHRIEAAYATRVDHDGPVTVGAFSPGCLARVDGVVPSYGQGTDLDGRPIPRPENWQQGAAVIVEHDDGSFDYEQVRIRDGAAWWRGRKFTA